MNEDKWYGVAGTTLKLDCNAGLSNELEFYDQGTKKWSIEKHTSNSLRIRDEVTGENSIECLTDAIVIGDGAWNGKPLLLGSSYLWVDATGDLRIKSGAPASDTDGTVVGTQT